MLRKHLEMTQDGIPILCMKEKSLMRMNGLAGCTGCEPAFKEILHTESRSWTKSNVVQ